MASIHPVGVAGGQPGHCEFLEPGTLRSGAGADPSTRAAQAQHALFLAVLLVSGLLGAQRSQLGLVALRFGII